MSLAMFGAPADAPPPRMRRLENLPMRVSV